MPREYVFGRSLDNFIFASEGYQTSRPWISVFHAGTLCAFFFFLLLV